jgi:hypothetical protein
MQGIAPGGRGGIILFYQMQASLHGHVSIEGEEEEEELFLFRFVGSGARTVIEQPAYGRGQ